ncbi:hypothetical protein CLAIMM_13879 [Cladophialophora immunda]|nr:hypothetical protein CLAIMM_13879 [Cladophialophora immunda]
MVSSRTEKSEQEAREPLSKEGGIYLIFEARSYSTLLALCHAPQAGCCAKAHFSPLAPSYPATSFREEVGIRDWSSSPMTFGSSNLLAAGGVSDGSMVTVHRGLRKCPLADSGGEDTG